MKRIRSALGACIAAALVVSVSTVDRHISNLYAKLGFTSRAEATALALRHRLVDTG